LAVSVLLLLPLALLPKGPPPPLTDAERLQRAAETPSVGTMGCTLVFCPISDRFNLCHDVAAFHADPPKSIRDYIHIQMFIKVWLAGAVVFMSVMMTWYIRYSRYLQKYSTAESDPVIIEMLRTEKERLGLIHPIQLNRHKSIPSPLLTGLVKPTILLPQKAYDADMMPLILRHELIHFKNKDVLRKYILVIIRCLLWFNPAVYLMVKQANEDLEIICDRETLRDVDINMKRDYAHMLLHVADKTNDG
jgi:beta-lactamase regulating signal transducer with metallopeptidase domain